VGEPRATLFAAGFEAGADGFVVSGDASGGHWLAGSPSITAHDGDVWQPGSAASGAGCLFTGQNPRFDALSSGDVDGGSTVARSPEIDLAGATAPVLRFRYWFAGSLSAVQPSDALEVWVEDSRGETRVFVERASASEWRQASVPLPPGIGPTVRVRFHATDDAAAANLVEAAIDDLEVVDFDCPGSSCGAGPGVTPNSLRLRREASKIVLTWEAAVGGGWNVHRSAERAALEEMWLSPVAAATVVTQHLDFPPAEATLFYQVFGADCGGNSRP
jgi:hypothetical protein